MTGSDCHPIDRQITVHDCIQINRLNVQRFCREFRVAVRLFELLQRGGDPNRGELGGEFIQFRMIAARDAALNVYHISKSLKAISNHLRSIGDEENPLGTTLTLFDQLFPGTDEIRHAIAHAGELFNSVPKSKISRQRKAAFFHAGHVGPGGILSAALKDKTYTVGRSGSVFSLEVNDTSAQKLEMISGLLDTALKAYGGETRPPSQT